MIGFVAGIVCFLAIMIKEKLGYDDSLDVVAVHGAGGLWGALATGLFASVGAQGLFFGNPRQLAIQALAALTVMVFSFVVSSIILLVLKKTIGLRMSEEDELQGLDLSQHGETGYYLW
jgi:Amt family ammonium transporter